MFLDRGGQHGYDGAMNKANISYARNHLSRILACVREGESVLIMDRQRPVARLEPVNNITTGKAPVRDTLVRRGLVRPARNRLDPRSLAKIPMPSVAGKGDVLNALLTDREEGR